MYLTALEVRILGLVVLIIALILCVSYLNPAKFNSYDVSLFLCNVLLVCTGCHPIQNFDTIEMGILQNWPKSVVNKIPFSQ